MGIVYTNILKVILIHDKVSDILQEKVSDDFYDLLSLYDNNFDLAVGDYGYSKTKYDCLRNSESVFIGGCGFYVGKKIAHLPFVVRENILKSIKKTEICIK